MRQKLRTLYSKNYQNKKIFNVHRSVSYDKEVLTSSSELKDILKKKKHNSDRLIHGINNN